MIAAAGQVGRGVALPVSVLLAAEIAARMTGYQSDSLARPSAVLAAFAQALADGSLLSDTVHTLVCAGLGLGSGALAGFLIGAAAGAWQPVNATLAPVIEALRPVPPIVLIPLALLVFGFGLRMEIASIVFGCIWPVLILTRAAVAGVEPGLEEVARVTSSTVGAVV